MSCREAYKLLSLYLDGLVSESDTGRLEIHVAGCVQCRGKLDLMKQIPEVLQSDKLLAPSEDFTKLVMQRVVMQQVVVNRSDKNGTNFSSYSRTQVNYISSQPRQTKTAEQSKLTEPGDDEPEPARIIRLDPQRNRPKIVPGAYLLRFTSMAAALVLGFGLLAYLFEVNGASGISAASSSHAVMAFADLLKSSFSSPWQVAIGAIVSAIIIVTLWLRLVRLRNKNK